MGRLTHRSAPGCTYFVTTKAWQNRAIFQVPENAEILIEVMLRNRDRGSFCLHEFVVMPDHLHLILTPDDRTTIERALQLIKGGSSHEIHRIRSHHMEIWQPGFHEWTIRNEADFIARRRYIHMNPVEAHLVDQPADWIYSSANPRFVIDPIPDKLRAASVAKANA